MDRQVIEDVSLETKEENGISVLCGREWEYRSFLLKDFHFPAHFSALPSMPIFRTRKPHPWNAHINDCRVCVGFGDKNTKILPLQVSTDSVKLVCTRRYCHHSSKHRDICFGYLFLLFSTTQGHLWFLRLTGSYFSLG